MNREISIFGDIGIDKGKFHYPIWIDDVDIDKMLISNKISFGEKGYIYILLVTKTMIIKLSHSV